jgi:hypothetical protein
VAAILAAGLALVGIAATTGSARADDLTVSYEPLRTGWDRNQPNLGPSDVGAPDFGQLFATQLDGQIYAQPVVARSTVLAVTENNKAYGLDPVSGAIRWSRSVGAPWPVSTIGCGDLVPNIGITSTPAVDSATGTAYFTAKVNDGPDADHPNWYMHAVDITTGSERSGFPTKIQGSPSNYPGGTFTPKSQMQRAGLLLLDGVVYAGFGSHCDFPPYAGYVVGVNATTGQQTAMWTTEVGSSSAGGGVWQAGGGLVSDGSRRIFLSTGNGVSPPPGTGSSPPGTLAESVIRLQVNSDGSLVSKDFFSPFNNTNLDTDDADIGSGGPMALPDGYGTASHPHPMVVAGKDGRVFLLDRDNLGGVAQGPGGTDATLQTVGPYNGVWGHPAFWGGDGGYVYLILNQGPLSAFKIGATAAGVPTLSRVATSTGSFGYTSGSPVVTSNGTTSGSALVWGVYSSGASGSGAQIRAYSALPSNGTMTLRYAAPIGTASKFAVPATEKGRVYVGNRTGLLYGFGRPTTVALQGSPTDFGSVAVGTTATKSVTVTALRSVTVNSVSTSSPFATNSTGLPRTLATGDTLTVPLSFTPTTPVSVSDAITFSTSSGPLAFDVHGLGTKNGLLATPSNLPFGDVPTGGRVTSSVNITNTGTTTTTITGVTSPAPPFTAGSVPATGSTLAAGASVSVPITFAPTTTGDKAAQLVISSSTGNVTVPLTGSGVAGAAKLTITPTDLDFGSIPVGTSVTKSFDISNTGNLLLTLSKAAPPAPPFIVADPVSEGQQLSPGDTIRQSVSFSPTSVGSFAGSYQITGNDGAGPQKVTVHGVATDVVRGPVFGPASKCLDVRGGGTADGSVVQIYQCNGTDAQGWGYWGDQSLRSQGKCLDISGGGTVNGTLVQLWTCNGTGAQVWTIQDNGALRNPQSGRCLDLPGGNTADGTALQIYDCNGTTAQVWQPSRNITSPPGPIVGFYSRCLDVRGGSNADGAVVQMYDCNGTAAQRWTLQGDHSVQAVGKCLDVAGGAVANGSPVQLWTCNGTPAQVWYPLVSGGLLNPQSGRCLDVPGANKANGTALQIYDCNGTGAQKWTLPA